MSNRIFYAVQNVNMNGIEDGIQSVSINASVDFEQVFALGNLDVYENIEGVPSVEFSVERAYPQSGGNTMWASFGNTTQAASIDRPTLQMSVADDNQQPYNAVGFCKSTGCYVSSWSCNFPIDGFATESVTLVSNDLQWGQGTATIAATPTGNAQFTDKVIRRKDLTEQQGERLQSVSFSADIGREDLFELGKKAPYFRAATFPIETTADWEYLDTAAQSGPAAGVRLNMDSQSEADITSDVTVAFNGVSIGGGARLNATNYSGGDAGGGNATVTYSYIAYNFLETN